jgi:hypothetical protein
MHVLRIGGGSVMSMYAVSDREGEVDWAAQAEAAAADAALEIEWQRTGLPEDFEIQAPDEDPVILLRKPVQVERGNREVGGNGLSERAAQRDKVKRR